MFPAFIYSSPTLLATSPILSTAVPSHCKSDAQLIAYLIFFLLSLSRFLSHLLPQSKTTASVDLIDQQPELQWYMRPYLVDFLIEIHQQHRLRPETLYLALNIVDRYVSKRIVFKVRFFFLFWRVTMTRAARAVS